MQSEIDKKIPFPKRIGIQLISMIQVSKGMNVLDLGCGFGGMATILSELVGPEGKVVAIDPAADRIKVAKVKNARPNIEYSVGNDQNIPDDQYDVVFANGIVQWVSNKEALFQRVYDKLRPGGAFALSTPNECIDFPTSSLKCFDLLHHQFLEEVYYRKMLVEVASVYESISTSVGYQVGLMESMVMLHLYNNTEELIEWYIKHFPDNFTKESIDRSSLQIFNDTYEKDIPKEPVPYNMLFMCLIKPE